MQDQAERYDVLILGAGIAGAAAACAAAKQGLKAVVVEQTPREGTKLAAEWLHPDAVAILDAWGIKLAAIRAGAIKRVRFVDVGGKREIEAALDEGVDIVDGLRLRDAMLDVAAKQGAELRFEWQAASIDIGERGVTLANTHGETVDGRLLVAANGCHSIAIEKVAGTAGRGPGIRACCAHAACDSGKSDAADCLTVLLDSNDMSQFGYAHAAGKGLALGFVANLPSDQTAAAFVASHAKWVAAQYLPPECAKPAGAYVRPLARGLALEKDSQVGKNTLVVGDAGGFVSAISHEGLYPALRSAVLAVDVAAKAVASTHPQDVLLEYDAIWRGELVDHLRMPNADLRFLLPLVFSNERMAVKMAEAVLLGKNI